MSYPVILYQMGKVGSSTLKQSLNLYKIKTMHVHRFYFSNNERPLNFKDRLQKIKHNLVINKILKNEAQELKIITFYRDPLSRNISSFFQNLNYYFSSNELKQLNFEILKNKFNNSHQLHQTPNNWFDLEFKRKTGIDIFKHPFNKEKGYTTIKDKQINIFVCTTNNINKLENELGQFLELQNFKIHNDNIGDNKWYKELYTEFKQRYIPKQNMINTLYDSETIKHFFSTEKINELKTRWINEFK